MTLKPRTERPLVTANSIRPPLHPQPAHHRPRHRETGLHAGDRSRRWWCRSRRRRPAVEPKASFAVVVMPFAPPATEDAALTATDVKRTPPPPPPPGPWRSPGVPPGGLRRARRRSHARRGPGWSGWREKTVAGATKRTLPPAPPPPPPSLSGVRVTVFAVSPSAVIVPVPATSAGTDEDDAAPVGALLAFARRSSCSGFPRPPPPPITRRPNVAGKRRAAVATDRGAAVPGVAPAAALAAVAAAAATRVLVVGGRGWSRCRLRRRCPERRAHGRRWDRRRVLVG